MFPQLNTQPLSVLSTVQLLPLGTIVFDPRDQSRRAYRYVRFGGTSTINPGLLLVAAAAPSNSTGLALNSANSTAQLAAGSTSGSLVITNGSTTVVQDQFLDGMIDILGTNGVETYRILGNTADSTGSLPITIRMEAPLRNTSALVVGTNTVNLRQNMAYNPAASLTAALPVGVTFMPVPNTASVTNFGWVQIAGECLVNATSATKADALVQDTGGTAGYFANSAASTSAMVAVAKESAASNIASVQLAIA